MIDHVPMGRFQVELKNSEEFSEEDVMWGEGGGGVGEEGGGHSRNSSLVLSEEGDGVDTPNDSFDDTFDDIHEERNEVRRAPGPSVYGSMPVQRCERSPNTSCLRARLP